MSDNNYGPVSINTMYAINHKNIFCILIIYIHVCILSLLSIEKVLLVKENFIVENDSETYTKFRLLYF